MQIKNGYSKIVIHVCVNDSLLHLLQSTKINVESAGLTSDDMLSCI